MEAGKGRIRGEEDMWDCVGGWWVIWEAWIILYGHGSDLGRGGGLTRMRKYGKREWKVEKILTYGEW